MIRIPLPNLELYSVLHHPVVQKALLGQDRVFVGSCQHISMQPPFILCGMHSQTRVIGSDPLTYTRTAPIGLQQYVDVSAFEVQPADSYTLWEVVPTRKHPFRNVLPSKEREFANVAYLAIHKSKENEFFSAAWYMSKNE